VNAERDMFSAVSLRTPLTGMRCSRSAPKLAATVAGAATVSGSAAAGVPLAARCTSSRVIEPSGPDPVSVARSTPRSLASFRTGGLASTDRPIRPVPSTAGAGDAGATGAGAGTGWTGAAAAWAGRPPLRGRRFAAVVRGP
jgi:hypothetical protein